MKTLFRNRMEAGRLLVARLAGYAGQEGVVVCALPRGGVVVAAEVARGLKAPLEVLVVRRLSLPCQPEVAMGAIAPDGVCVLNDDVIDRLDIESDAIGAVHLNEQRELERRSRCGARRRSSSTTAVPRAQPCTRRSSICTGRTSAGSSWRRR